MRQSRKSIDHCDIVIVCEGSTTEYNYFCEIRDYLNMLAIKKSPYTHILIIPGDTDPIIAKSGRPLRKMNPDASQWRYYIMSEENETDYRQYCAQPIRYVREAELFLKYRNYDEAWAVYDWDEKLDNRQKKHEEVIPILNRNSGRLSIAFSSYSFEEWILAHFEHNSTKYYESDCSDSFGHSYMCGSTKANPDNDCHGERCIAGYLRSRGYIPFYSKGDKRIFSNITLKEGKISRKALINASWLRSKGSCFSSDAYTTVDILVCKLMAEDYRCDWCRIGSSFAFSRTTLKIVENDGSYIVQNMGDISIILNSSNIFSTDAGGSMERSLLNIFFLLEPGGCYSIEKNNVDSLLKFSTDNHDVFVELQ